MFFVIFELPPDLLRFARLPPSTGSVGPSDAPIGPLYRTVMWRPVADDGRRLSTSRGDKVVFRIADAFLPQSEELKLKFPERVELEGTVIDFSDSGGSTSVFALVEVIHKQTVVLPIDRLKLADSET